MNPGSGNGDNKVDLKILRISHVFANAIRDILESRFLKETAPAPLSVSQIHLLKLIDMNGDHFVGEIAEFLGVSAPAASKNVDKLARLELLRRVTPERDRRNTCLKITPKGHDLVHRYESRREEGLRPVLEKFSSEERVQFARLLEKFVTTLIDIEERGDRGCLRCGAYYEKGCPVHGVTGQCPYEQARRTTMT